MKYGLQIFLFLLPFHAIMVTYLKCKIGIDTDILRFWKEIFLLFLFLFVVVQVLIQYKWNIKNIYKNNTLLGVTTAFILCSFVFVFFPYFDVKIQALLGFKYDVFFLFALIIGLYLIQFQKYFETMLKTVFVSIGLMLVIFLPWYILGDIQSSTHILGFSEKPSTYEANSCISFAQNVTGGHHRFQGSFGDPIRLSVFLTIFYFIYLGFILQITNISQWKKYILILFPTFFVLSGIFFAYTKTSMLGFLFGGILFLILTQIIIYKRKIQKKYLLIVAFLTAFILFFLLYIKRHLFLHPEAILGRVENLTQSIDMFFYNPLGYGLGIAGPASQLATSSDSTLSNGVQKFLPENWYVQILLEQGLLGVSLFISIIVIIAILLWKIVKRKKDFLSIGIFTSYISILFMANFTHIFEESATSFILFLIIGAYISKENRIMDKVK